MWELRFVLFILGAAVALKLPAIPPSAAALSPCPRRQLLCYVAHAGGSGDPEVAVFARADGTASSWLQVGSVAAGLQSEGDLSPTGMAESAAAAAAALVNAAQVQRRLISEHACRIHPELRQAKRGDGIQLGLQLGTSGDAQGIVSVAPSASGDATRAQLMACGFAGDVPAPLGAGRAPKGIYADFWAAGGAPEYDRDAVRAQIRQRLAPSRLICEGGAPAVVIFAWRRCGYATKARAALDARGIAYTSVELDKMGPLHAELALSLGRPTVPYVFVRGECVGGYDADELPGLVGVIDSLG